MPETKQPFQRIMEGLPALDCGLCGSRTCEDFAHLLVDRPEEKERCIHLSKKKVASACAAPATMSHACGGCDLGDVTEGVTWKDSLGREYDFVLDTFPNEPGPRETILPHNPQITKELGIVPGDILIGRPMGMSCGCPITHCGVAMEVDTKNGVMVWCVTGPLNPRAGAHKDIGYYSAQAYEGLVRDTHAQLEIGRRYWFLPRRCMLQWRHSGLVNFVRKTKDATQIRIEGLYIG